MLLEASDVEIFAVKVEVDFYFEMEEVLDKQEIKMMNFYRERAHASIIC